MSRPVQRRALLAMGMVGSAWLSGGCATVMSTARIEPGADEPRESWQRVLARFVDAEGRVAFERLARDRTDLNRYVAWVNHHGPATRPERFGTRAQVLAHHINAYNALAMHAIIDAGIPETLAGLRKVTFFLLKKVQVDGVAMSLADYENKVIRPLGEPRVHFALNCMSVGCPRLPQVPFDAAQLEVQLEAETRRFFAEPRNLEVDAARREVWLTEILSFFPQDFLAVAPSLIAYVNRYRAASLPPVPQDYAVRFRPYDWTVNRQPG